jgi:hypothetical protein
MRPPEARSHATVPAGSHATPPGWAHAPTRHHLDTVSLWTVSSPSETPEALARGPRVWWLGLSPRRRRLLRALLAVGIVVVLAVGAVLARFLSVENAERADDLALIQAEASGDAAAMLDRLSGCRESRSCVASVTANAANPHVRRAGGVKILQLEASTAYAPFGATGETRLAWTVIGTLPVVQCVDVRRSGNFLSGIHVQLIGLSAPIGGEGVCHKRTRNEIEEEEDTAVER